MKSKRIIGACALALSATLALGSCASNEMPNSGGNGSVGNSPGGDSALAGTLNGMGSSAQSAAQSIWAAGFEAAHGAVTLNYDPQGSGAGRRAFTTGAVAFAGSDAPLSAAELADAGGAPQCAAGFGPVNLPVYVSPIAIAYNLPEVTELRLDADALALIFRGEITEWSDDRLVALNPGAELPNLPITVVRRSDDSGTTQNFTEYLAANAATAWGAEPSQTFPYPIGDAAKGTSGVADASRSAHGAIAYIDLSGASGLQTASLRVGDGYSKISAAGAATVVAVSPLNAGATPGAGTAGADVAADAGASTLGSGDLAIDIDRTVTEANSWPLVLVSYLITCERYADPKTGALVSAYVSHVASPAAQQAAAEGAGSAPLALALAERVHQVTTRMGASE